MLIFTVVLCIVLLAILVKVSRELERLRSEYFNQFYKLQSEHLSTKIKLNILEGLTPQQRQDLKIKERDKQNQIAAQVFNDGIGLNSL